MPTTTPGFDTGTPGKSAGEMYRRRRAADRRRRLERWGRVAPVVELLAGERRATAAWQTGADGEVRLAARMARLAGDRATFLYDRKVPGTRGNIDMVAVAPSGVWVVDAKAYLGTVTTREVGGWFTSRRRLLVAGRDRTSLADGMAWQTAAVERAVADPCVPVHGALCFLDAEWRLFARPARLGGVWIIWPKRLAKMIGAPGSLDAARMSELAVLLSQRLPSA